MTDAPTPEGLSNFRDLGGHRTADGRTVRPGLLYRSDSLGRLTGPGLDTFAALLLTLLGVPEDDVLADFARTGDATVHLVAAYRTRHGRDPHWPGYGRAPAGIMQRFLAGLAARYGSVAGYAQTRLGADDALAGSLRTRLLTA